jgi:hypothetical protein
VNNGLNDEWAVEGLEKSSAPAIIGGLLVLGGVAVLAWLGFGGMVPEPPAPVLVNEARTQVVRPVFALVPAASAPAAEDCGVPGASSFDEVARAENTSRMREKLQTSLAQSTDELNQATALVLRSGGGQPVFDSVIACEGETCPTPAEKVESSAAAKARIGANTAPRDALARMALVSQSAPIYAMAWQLCRSHGLQDTSSACHMLSAPQWARLDPHNAAAWLAVAEQAQVRGDGAAQFEAMFQLSKARTFDLRWGAAMERVLKQAPVTLPVPDALALVADLQRLERSAVANAYQLPLQYCSPARQRDSNIQQQCAEVAQMLVTHGRSLADLKAGVVLGEQGAMPVERVAALTAEHETLTAALEDAQSDVTTLSHCAAVQQHLEQVLLATAKGELAVARQAVLVSR